MSIVKVIKNQVLRTFVFALGSVCVILGLVGIFVPLLPSTPFVLLAAWCFVRSSEKAHAWIYNLGIFGKALNDWDRNRSIAPFPKVLAVSMIAVSVIIILLRVENPWVRNPVVLLLAGVSLFIVTRKSS